MISMSKDSLRPIAKCLVVFWILAVLFVYWLLSGVPISAKLLQLRSSITRFLSADPGM